jgi:cell division protein FtsW
VTNAGTLRLSCDNRILLIVVLITVAGASIVASSSSYFAAAKFSDPYFLLKRHMIRIFLASIFLLLAINIDYRFYRRLSPIALAVGVFLLLGLFLYGYAIRHSVRWYHIGAFRMTLQPSEFARLALVLFLAYWITLRGKQFSEFKRGFLPAALAIACVVGLMAAQPNYGTAASTALVALAMLFIGGARLSHLGAFVLGAGATAAIKMLSTPYAMERIQAFLHRSDDLKAANWQLHQSLIALGSGGIFGAGIGESQQKLSWLPDSHTDFIFSILGEEAGLAGTVLVSLLFLLFVLRSLKIAHQCGDRFGELLAAGLGCSIFIYAVLNMAVATGLFPVTGLPLPFLSYGGSALVVNAVSVGILLNISALKTVKRRHVSPWKTRTARTREA